MRQKLLLFLLSGLLLPFKAVAENTTDFVALLMNDLAEEQEASPKEEYGCITVSPAMMEKVLNMIQEKDAKENDEQIKRILPHVKSMRIFTATKHIGKYYTEATTLLDKKAKSYKPFKADEKKSKKPCVWIRRNGNKVIEMVVMEKKEDEALHIINITGDMNKAFVDELLKM